MMAECTTDTTTSSKNQRRKHARQQSNSPSSTTTVVQMTTTAATPTTSPQLQNKKLASTTSGASSTPPGTPTSRNARKHSRPRSTSDIDPRGERNTEKWTAEADLRVVKATAFAARPSPFDLLHEQSGIRTSEFRGFFNLVLIGGLIFVCTSNARHLFTAGTLVGLKTLTKLIPVELIPAWLALVIFSFSVVLIEKLKLRGVPSALVWFLYISMQSIILGGTIALLWMGEWPVIPTGVYLGEAIIILMKVHSFFITNRQFGKEVSIAARHGAEASKGNQRSDKSAKLPSPTRKPAIPPQTDNPTDTEAAAIEALHQQHMERRGSLPLGDAWETFPENITFTNFFYFLCFPTLVYELNYPRTAKVRAGYIIEKCVLCLGIFSVLHVLINQYIYPVLLQVKHITFFEAILGLLVPFMFCYILVFFILFDVICNGFAEVTRFSDRRFYSDWWNSTTWDEFARKWNQPVHEWLLRHVYMESLQHLGPRRRVTATLLTFLISSIVHELVLTTMSRVFMPWMFVLQMAQVPLIYLGRNLKGTRAGNFVFWGGMLFGPPLICLLYCREYMLVLSDSQVQAMAVALLDTDSTCMCANLTQVPALSSV